MNPLNAFGNVTQAYHATHFLITSSIGFLEIIHTSFKFLDSIHVIAIPMCGWSILSSMATLTSYWLIGPDHVITRGASYIMFAIPFIPTYWWRISEAKEMVQDVVDKCYQWRVPKVVRFDWLKSAILYLFMITFATFALVAPYISTSQSGNHTSIIQKTEVINKTWVETYRSLNRASRNDDYDDYDEDDDDDEDDRHQPRFRRPYLHNDRKFEKDFKQHHDHKERRIKKASDTKRKPVSSVPVKYGSPKRTDKQ